MRLRVIRVDLPLKHVFTNSRSSVSVVRTIIVELEQDGLRGHGEACEDTFYGINVEAMYRSVERIRPQIEQYALADPIAFWNYLAPELGKNRFAQAAVDMAACDLWGKMKNRPLWKLWGHRPETSPHSCVEIGLDSLDRMLELVKEYADWPIMRIRLGVRDDLKILKALREVTQAEFHVDINGTWETETALSYLKLLHQLRVTLLEQPLSPTNWKGMELLKEKSSIPIIADESWMGEEDFTQIAEYFDGVRLKLTKCGGLTPARNLIVAAKHHGLKVAMGNAIESCVGVCATAQLAPLLDYVSLNGPMSIEKKVGAGIRLEKGRMFYPEECGTGVRVFFR